LYFEFFLYCMSRLCVSPRSEAPSIINIYSFRLSFRPAVNRVHCTSWSVYCILFHDGRCCNHDTKSNISLYDLC
jgi:hypothetical protein